FEPRLTRASVRPGKPAPRRSIMLNLIDLTRTGFHCTSRGPAPTEANAKSLIIMTNRLWQDLTTNIKPRGLSRGDWIRTSDPLVPNQVRYRTALRPELLIKSRKNRTRRIPILR